MEKKYDHVKKGQYKLLGNTTSAIRTFFTSNRLLGENLVLPQLAPKTKRTIGFWLLGCAGLVYLTLGAGGIARISNYGHSMVNWDMVKSLTPPSTHEEWRREYENYVNRSEWKYTSSAHVATDRELVNFDDFKAVWKAEYVHRLLRAGLFAGFFIPFAGLWYRGMLPHALKVRLGIAGGIMVSQALLDVILTRNLTSHYDIPRFGQVLPNIVRKLNFQFRLAVHLGGNYAMYALFLWTGLSHLIPQHAELEKLAGIGRFKTSLQVTAFILFTTILIGAFMAGTDAGHLMNTWPSYDGKFWPDTSIMIAQHPLWKNLYDNPVTVQFMHRHWGYFTFASVAITWWIGHKLPLNPRARIALNTLLALALVQGSLGVFTLINHVPVWLASLHQNGSIGMATVALWLMNEVRRIPK